MAKIFDERLDPLTDGQGDRQFVTALARGLEVLRAFEPDDGPLGNQEIADRTGLPRPTVSRLTHTLTVLGYLEYHPRQAKYALGAAVLALGLACRSAIAVREAARPLMRAAADALDATVALAARDRLSMIYLELHHGPSTAALRLDVGARVPVERSAIGMAYLYALPKRERDVLLEALKRRAPADWHVLCARLDQAFEEMERDGFCVVMGLYDRSVHAVGVPLPGDAGENVHALGASAPAAQFSEARLRAEAGPKLVHLAAETLRARQAR